MDKHPQGPIKSLDLREHIPIVSQKCQGSRFLRENSEGHQLMSEFLQQNVQSHMASGAATILAKQSSLSLTKHVHAKGFYLVRGLQRDVKKEWTMTNTSWEYMSQQDVNRFVNKTMHRKVEEINTKESNKRNSGMERKQGSGPIRSLDLRQHVPIIPTRCQGSHTLRETSEGYELMSKLLQQSVHRHMILGATPTDAVKKNVSCMMQRLRSKGFQLVRGYAQSGSGNEWTTANTHWKYMTQQDVYVFVQKYIEVRVRRSATKNKQASGRILTKAKQAKRAFNRTEKSTTGNRTPKSRRNLTKRQIPIMLDSTCAGATEFREMNEAFQYFRKTCNAVADDIVSRGHPAHPTTIDIAVGLFESELYGYSLVRSVRPKPCDIEWNTETTQWEVMEEQDAIQFVARRIRTRISTTKKKEKNQPASSKRSQICGKKQDTRVSPLTNRQIPIMNNRTCAGAIAFRETNVAFQYFRETCKAVAEDIVSRGHPAHPTPTDIAVSLFEKKLRGYSLVRSVQPKSHVIDWNVETTQWEMMEEQEAIRFVAQTITKKVATVESAEKKEEDQSVSSKRSQICGRTQDTRESSLTKRQIPIIHKECFGLKAFRNANQAFQHFHDTCDAIVDDIVARNTSFSPKEIAVGLFDRELRQYSLVRSIRPKSNVDWNMETTQWKVMEEQEAIQFVAATISKKVSYAKTTQKTQPASSKEVQSQMRVGKQDNSVSSLTNRQIPITPNISGAKLFREANEAFQYYHETCNAAVEDVVSRNTSWSPKEIAVDLFKSELRQYTLVRFIQPKFHVDWNVKTAQWKVLEEQEAIQYVATTISKKISYAKMTDKYEPASIEPPIRASQSHNTKQTFQGRVLLDLKRHIPITHSKGRDELRKKSSGYQLFSRLLLQAAANLRRQSGATAMFGKEDTALIFKRIRTQGYHFVRGLDPGNKKEWDTSNSLWEYMTDSEVHIRISRMGGTILSRKMKSNGRNITSKPLRKQGTPRTPNARKICKGPSAMKRRTESPAQMQKYAMSLHDRQIPIVHASCLGSTSVRWENKASILFHLRCGASVQNLVSKKSFSPTDTAKKLVQKDFHGYSFVRAARLKSAGSWTVEKTGWVKLDQHDVIRYVARTLRRKLGEISKATKKEKSRGKELQWGRGRKLDESPIVRNDRYTYLSGTPNDRNGDTCETVKLGSCHIPIISSHCTGAEGLREQNKNYQLVLELFEDVVKTFLLAQRQNNSAPSRVEMVESFLDSLDNEYGLTFVQGVKPEFGASTTWVLEETQWVEMNREMAKVYLSNLMGKKMKSSSIDMSRKRKRGSSFSPADYRNSATLTDDSSHRPPHTRDTKRVKVQQATTNTLIRNKKVAKQRKVTSVKAFNASCVNHIPKIDSKCLGAKRLREQSGGYVKLVELCNEEVQKCVDLHRDLLSSGKSPVVSHRDTAVRIFPQFSGFTFFRTKKKKGSRGEWNVENAHWKQMDEDEIVDYLTDNISSRYKTAVERLRFSFRKENERNQKVELFGDLLERAAKDSWGASMEEKEAGFTVRKANFDSKINGRWAPYGRMLPLATDRILRDILQLNRSDTFVDIGHGLGNAVLQAAYTIGCESRGIEIVDERFLLSEVLRDQLETVIASMSSGARKSMGSGGLKKGKVRLVCGGLEMKEHRDFLSCASGGGVVKAFADNFNGVFAARCSTGDKVWLDHSIAGLFALMPPGSKLVTLHELSIMPSRSVANAERVDRKKLTASSEASFYEMETVVLGKANECLSWSSKGSNEQDVILYVYTRLAQKSLGAVFLCANPNCKHSQSEAPLCATKTVTDKDGIEKLVLNDSCPNCNQNLRPSRSRMIKEEKPRMVKEDKPRMIKEKN